MRELIRIKEGLWGNVACILFLLLLAGGALWVNSRSGHSVNWFVMLWCLGILGGCLFPIRNILSPKEYILAVDDVSLIWRMRRLESGPTEERGVPLKSIKAIEFVLPRVVAVTNPRYYHLARAFLVTQKGERIEIPFEFYPGVHRQRIVSALQQHIPDLKVVELLDKV